MYKPLTNNIVDERLKNRTIKRVGDYINNCTLILFQCNECKFIWNVSPANIMLGRGCPKCSHRLKLTDQIIDERLKDRNIKRIDSYINENTPMQFQCLIPDCNYIWKTCTGVIVQGRKAGCPNCAGNAKLTNDILDSFIKDKFIRLDNVNGARIPISFKCIKCNHIWSATPSNIKNNITGCPKCKKCIPLNNNYVDEQIKYRDILRLEDINGSKNPISFQCNICLTIWKTSPDRILNAKTGCPSCPKKNETLINKIFIEQNIPYSYQKQLRTVDINAPKLVIDYAINGVKIFIEYNGAQHYRPVCFGGIDKIDAEQAFKRQQLRDKNLQNWCDANEYILICIDGRSYYNEKLIDYMVNNIIPLIKCKLYF